jgi:CMP/dCMP kinase
MPKIIIAVDGYSSCGKSTTAKSVAKHLGYAYIDTGAMYRAVTLYFIQNHVSLNNDKEINKALDQIHIDFKRNEDGQNQTYLNGVNVEDEIRKLYVANLVSEVSAIKTVRLQMVDLQRKMGKKRGFVMDGRDIGTVVFPDADLKVYMTADPTVRAHRRQIELFEKGEVVDLKEIIENIKKRDIIDTTRQESPLRKAEDAHLIDTTYMTLEEQVDQLVLMADMAVTQKAKRKHA